ncbi:unnamed protein product [Boreogadus saida]
MQLLASGLCHHNALGIHNGVEFHRYTPSILRSSSAKQPCDTFSKCEKGLDLKMNLMMVCAVALLGACQPAYECRAVESRTGSRLSDRLQHLPLPILLRLGEQYSIQLDNSKQDPSPVRSDLWSHGPSPASTVNRALQLTQRKIASSEGQQEEDSAEKEKRSDDPPISLDLTFHLLREVLEMARAEQLAQQANDNRKMMDIFGK